MTEKVTSEQIKAILEKNGIKSIDDLAKKLSTGRTSPAGTFARQEFRNGNSVSDSWIIKVWKLDKKLKSDITKLPQKLGGNILKNMP